MLVKQLVMKAIADVAYIAIGLFLSACIAALLYFPVFFLVSVLIWLTKGQFFGFGESFFHSYLFRITIWNGDALIFSPDSNSTSRLRHSQIYEHPEVITFIAKWIKKF